MDQVKAILVEVVVYFLRVLEYFNFEGVDAEGFETWLNEQLSK